MSESAHTINNNNSVFYDDQYLSYDMYRDLVILNVCPYDMFILIM